MGKIADFYAELKIKDALSMTLKTALQAMGDLRLTTIGEITALGVLADGLVKAGQQAIEMSTGYTTLSKELDINTDKLQRWQNVARSKTTVAPAAVADSFAYLEKVLAGWSHGRIDQNFMMGASFLGMQIPRGMTRDQILEVLRTRVPESISRVGASRTWDALHMMGLDRIMQLLMLNQRQFRAGEYSSPIIGKTPVGEWTELGENIKTVSYNLMMLGEKVLEPMLPTLIELTEILLDTEKWAADKVGKIPAAWHSTEEFMRQIDTFQDKINRSMITFNAPDVRPIVQHNSAEVNFHLERGDPYAISAQIKPIILSAFRDVMTTAAQTQNSQTAY
jgi:hypothetical protein